MLTSFPETKNNWKIWLAAIALLAVGFGAGLGVGQSKISLQGGKVEINKGISNSADYSLLWEALDELNAKFVDKPLDQQKLLFGAVKGLVAAAGDPYTTFFDPQEAKQFADELQGTFEGVGMEVGVRNEQIVVIAPLDGMPAQKAGILAGDVILGIDDISTATMSVDDAVSRIRGKAGTSVKLTILHKGKKESEEIKITRQKIEYKSVDFSTKEVNNKKIGVIKMNRFGEDTRGLLDHAVDVIVAGNYKGVIVDLRNNPGGYLDVAITSASNWVGNGDIVVKEVSFGDQVKEYKARGVTRLKGMETVVLVNGGSASASEILAGALQDHKLATLVGEKTFGKGSVQELSDLKGGSTLKITIAKWQTPKGRSINKNGLDPDIQIELTSDDLNNDKDPQMDKAVELLSH
ncbi:MAG: S41 family peptidase [Candidatus Doudnabacteria bacterium]|nr:S41 family peptidase [Candidatus Doudnabacteria bacterium]